MRYEERDPPRTLHHVVRCFWLLRMEGPSEGAAEPAIPDGSPELIVSVGDPIRARDRTGRLRRQPPAMLVGQITRPFAVWPTGAVDLVAARLHPYGAVWLTPTVSRITDGWQALGANWTRLPTLMASARGADARVRVLADALERAIVRERGPDARVVRAVDRIVATHGAEPAARLAELSAVTPRHLQRLFADQVGVTPKLLARIRRVQRVFAAWRDAPGTWSRVAAECGYFDQAHLVRDFREIAGGAPAGLIEAMPAFTRAFTPLGSARHS